MTVRSSITLRYASQRKDIWKHYWMRWRQPNGLWRQWLLVALLIALTLFVMSGFQSPTPRAIAIAAACLAIVYAFFAAFPMIVFKPAERILTIDPRGIDTRIGGKSANRSWREIRAITDRGDVIEMVVAATGNAFVVPDRAFPAAQDRGDFLDSVRAWHAAANGDAAAHFE